MAAGKTTAPILLWSSSCIAVKISHFQEVCTFSIARDRSVHPFPYQRDRTDELKCHLHLQPKAYRKMLQFSDTTLKVWVFTCLTREKKHSTWKMLKWPDKNSGNSYFTVNISLFLIFMMTSNLHVCFSQYYRLHLKIWAGRHVVVMTLPFSTKQNGTLPWMGLASYSSHHDK